MFAILKEVASNIIYLDGMLVHPIVTHSRKFAGTHLYTRVETGAMRVKCLAQEYNTVPWVGLKHGPPDPESSTLTIRPPLLPLVFTQESAFVL